MARLPGRVHEGGAGLSPIQQLLLPGSRERVGVRGYNTRANHVLTESIAIPTKGVNLL